MSGVLSTPLPLGPPLSQGRRGSHSLSATLGRVIALAVVTDCPPETGGTSEAEGVDGFRFPFLYLTQRSQRAQSFISLPYSTLALEWS